MHIRINNNFCLSYKPSDFVTSLEKSERANLYLKLFKLVFGSVSLFAQENEQMLKVFIYLSFLSFVLNVLWNISVNNIYTNFCSNLFWFSSATLARDCEQFNGVGVDSKGALQLLPAVARTFQVDWWRWMILIVKMFPVCDIKTPIFWQRWLTDWLK